ncbi:muscle M-line assembly protein unc-89-like [Armigeres subalbatus]|uniref:muscle M-line assembly protein unc-89-like n=1 Tax=Armigeres subalbatus TaxID=124917 RepID=UPI002ED5AAFC
MSVDETKMEPLPMAATVGSDEQSTVASLPEPSLPTVPVPPPPPIGVRIRPKICDVRNCNSDSLRNPELLFVCVPTHNYPERRFVWLTLMQAMRDKKRSYCCSRHFTIPDDFKDFQEFISAPPGYKRQLLVKKGVVPHLNMPPLNMSALPPLTDRWPMTLPEGMTEVDQLRHNAMAHRSMPPPLPMRPTHLNPQQMARAPSGSPIRVRHSRGVQTDSTPTCIGGRTIAPSLQYCRLCFQKQDLEPIFTGDQTLIEPDLIDKIYGCTEVMISVESDFPSSICTACYTKVQDYVKFRKLVQLNNQSLRGVLVAPQPTNPNRRNLPAVPRRNSVIRKITTGIVSNRPTLKVTPLRPVTSTPPSSTQRSPATPQRDDPLLEVQRVENVERYQRRQQTIERNQPLRANRVQDTLYPVPYRRPVTDNATVDDPLASAEGEQKLSSDSEGASTPTGVQLDGRVVPVTLIRVQQEISEGEYAEPKAPNEGQGGVKATDQLHDATVKEEEPSAELLPPEIVNTNVGFSPARNIIRAKPLHQLLRSIERKKQNAPSVLQAVKLLPSATAKALASQKSSLKPVNTLTRGVTSGRFAEHSMRSNLVRTIPKQTAGRMFQKSIPGSLYNLIHRAKKLQSTSPSPSAFKQPDTAKISSTPSPDLELIETQQPVQEKLGVKPSTPTSTPKSKNLTDSQEKQKENSISDTPFAPRIVPISSPKPTAKLSDQLSTAPPIPVSKPAEPVVQTKLKDSSNVKVGPPKLNRLAVVLSRLATPSSAQKPKPSKPVSKPKEKDNNVTETAPTRTIPAESLSPRSSRVRKVPLKFKNTVGFPMPKVVTIKPDPDVAPVVPSQESKEKTQKATEPQEKSKKLAESKEITEKPSPRVTRRSNVIDEKPTADTPKVTKKPETTKETVPKSKPKENDPPRKEPPRVTRRSDVAIAKPEEDTQRVRAAKRKSDNKPEPKPHAPPPSKSPRVDSPKTKVQEASTSKVPKAKEQPQQKAKQAAVQATDKRKETTASTSVEAKIALDPLTLSVPVKKPKKRQELERAKTPVSSKDWKCPFCPNKVFEEKKRLVKHLRKRHGMDYALVRQRLAIYGGNWR